ncbi:MAG: PTS sugar transporter subunit IIA [Candidatus Omnitrophica bacterium]|nr:PTS sugar transporter subunit IIA [Candidatus Omnitrophota bacterium]
MKIMDFLCERAISLNLRSTEKKNAIEELVELLIKGGELKESDKQEIMEILLNRESLGSTGIGQGIGIPHGKSCRVNKLVAAFGISKKGINFDALDGEPVYIFFLILAPEEFAGPHLKALASISRLLKDKYFRDSLLGVENENNIVKIIKDEDQKRA